MGLWRPLQVAAKSDQPASFCSVDRKLAKLEHDRAPPTPQKEGRPAQIIHHPCYKVLESTAEFTLTFNRHHTP